MKDLPLSCYPLSITSFLALLEIESLSWAAKPLTFSVNMLIMLSCGLYRPLLCLVETNNLCFQTFSFGVSHLCCMYINFPPNTSFYTPANKL